MAVKYFCDRCGEEMARLAYVKVGGYEFCSECIEAFKIWVKGRG
jgi:DNA-directed RNA polymerase subunit RPC12/RpoP